MVNGRIILPIITDVDTLWSSDGTSAGTILLGSMTYEGYRSATVDANTALDVLDLSAQRTQVALRNGSALFDVGSPAELFEVATPCGAVDFERPGIYQIALNENGNAVATAPVSAKPRTGRLRRMDEPAATRNSA